MVSKFDEIPWNEIIKKEARGIDNADFGEIKNVNSESVLAQKGLIDKEFFSFPKNLVQGYDGDRVWFKVTEEEARNSYMQSQNVDLDQGDSSSDNKIEKTETSDEEDNSLSNTKEEEEQEKIIPLMAEKLDITKTEVIDEVIITKEPVKDTKTEQIPVMHEELTIEIRPVTNDQSSSYNNNNNNNNNNSMEQKKEILKPVENKTNIRIPLKREEVEVSRTPYVKEEIVVKKKPVTETRTVSEEIITEKVQDPPL
ncbi:MAG TPA: YsnF/AvaK domain-containing protein [Nitrososphaeraceae archaeon]|nr:YsnF/AvaK domain-containing protein [Nitrososphaeraceae archaeon]